MSEARKDGGPAFPEAIAIGTSGDIYPGMGGMSLRDWFAGQAISICSGNMREYDLEKAFGGRNTITTEEIIAHQAYTLADAMLAASANGGNQP